MRVFSLALILCLLVGCATTQPSAPVLTTAAVPDPVPVTPPAEHNSSNARVIGTYLLLPDDYREHANLAEFLAHVARRCDSQLATFGKIALTDKACDTFIVNVPQMVRLASEVTTRANAPHS